jgi:hypothetical protein
MAVLLTGIPAVAVPGARRGWKCSNAAAKAGDVWDTLCFRKIGIDYTVLGVILVTSGPLRSVQRSAAARIPRPKQVIRRLGSGLCAVRARHWVGLR